MSLLLAGLIGYLIGSIPTASAIARFVGIELLEAGSKNPGTNNARRLGGYRLAVPILMVEIGKGFGCVWAGLSIAGEIGAIVGGLAGILGNVANIWHGFRGGKGLGISAGVILALLPAALLPIVGVIALVAALTKSTGLASLAAMGTLIVLSFLWAGEDWPNEWGIADTGLLPYFAIPAAAIVVPKHYLDAATAFKELSPP